MDLQEPMISLVFFDPPVPNGLPVLHNPCVLSLPYALLACLRTVLGAGPI